VAEVCQQDIHGFIERGYREQGVIHPNPLGYHFDIMVPWGDVNKPYGVFFLSFHPAMLSRVLQRLQPPGHKLMLVNKTRPGLIEVTAEGARDSLQREFFLDKAEQDRIIATGPIADSRWELIDLPDEQLLYHDTVRNWAYAIVVFSVFAGITLLLFYQLRRKERFRLQAEERALQHQNELAHVDRLNILGQMASGIAHELNQPLSAISTYCQSGLRIIDTLEEKPEKLTHVMESSSRQAKRAGEIIHRMREFAAKGKAQPRTMDINRVITEATDFVKPLLLRKHISARLDLAPGLPVIMADAIQIEQVILNLLHNAMDAMAGEKAGSRRLTVTSRLADDDQIEVRVSDLGHGLNPAISDKMFDTFYTTKEGGMGLGLAISRSIVESHGGQLLAEANDGPGATISFTIPVHRSS
jgi:signal transduction histidine kinase